ncbi:MAG: hypothetical protein LBS10_04755 [Gracilibacteraceae bacterium]|jgi:hypothetical protein|nr:hypothetical protein [Gracilibacteraceae bacterium]
MMKMERILPVHGLGGSIEQAVNNFFEVEQIRREQIVHIAVERGEVHYGGDGREYLSAVNIFYDKD